MIILVGVVLTCDAASVRTHTEREIFFHLNLVVSEQVRMNIEPLVSVVIPTYNSERTLARCLESVTNQTYKNIEVVIVDKNSCDKTVAIAKGFGARVFVVNAEERSQQMNFGIRQSKGKYVYRIDSDFIIEPEVVEEAVRKCEYEGYDAVCIHNTSDSTISFWSRVRKLERDCYRDDELNVAARFFKKEVLEAVGGFNTSLVAGEDYELQKRIKERGFRIGKIQHQEVHIGEPRSLSEIVRKHYYYGKSIEEFIRATRREGIKQLSPIRPAFIRHWKDFTRNPILTFGFIVYQSVRYLATALGFLVNKLEKQV